MVKIHPLSVARAVSVLKSGEYPDSFVPLQFSGWLLVSLVLHEVDLLAVSSSDGPSVGFLLTAIVVSAAGLFWCYRRAGTRDFPVRFSVVAFPLTLRFAIAYQCIYWLGYFSYPAMAAGLSDASYVSWWLSLERAFSLFMSVLWYVRMAEWMRRAT
jgi:hypothetical protein